MYLHRHDTVGKPLRTGACREQDPIPYLEGTREGMREGGGKELERKRKPQSIRQLYWLGRGTLIEYISTVDLAVGFSVCDALWECFHGAQCTHGDGVLLFMRK